MGMLRKPELPEGAHRDLRDALHELHRKAGRPSVRDLERALGDGVAARTRIYDAFTAARLPSWGLLSVLVPELASRVPRTEVEKQVERFHRLWDAAAEAEEAQTGGWSVVLTDPGRRRIQLVDAVRSFTGVGLAEARAMMDAPSTVATDLPRDDAERFASRLLSLGATADVCPAGKEARRW